jgi:hypothetical protein
MCAQGCDKRYFTSKQRRAEIAAKTSHMRRTALRLAICWPEHRRGAAFVANRLQNRSDSAFSGSCPGDIQGRIGCALFVSRARITYRCLQIA